MKKAIRGKYKIIKNGEISPGLFELTVETPDIAGVATAGQFVNVYLPGGETILPRPISIAGVSGNDLTVVYAVIGKGTKTMTGFGAGDMIEIMGPLGTGFFDYIGSPTDESSSLTDNEDSTILLIGGGAGIPPLRFAAEKLKATKKGNTKIVAALGYAKAPWYQEEFKEVCDEVLLISETPGETSISGRVTDLLNGIENPCFAITCGPRPMLKAVSDWCSERKVPLRVSMEERMGCGYGACAGCIIKTIAIDDPEKPQKGPNNPDSEGIIRKKVCVHGPVFWADEICW